METDLLEQVNEVKRRIELRHEDEKKELEDLRRSEVDTTEKRYKDLIRILETENNDYKKLKFGREELETQLEGYKLEVKV